MIFIFTFLPPSFLFPRHVHLSSTPHIPTPINFAWLQTRSLTLANRSSFTHRSPFITSEATGVQDKVACLDRVDGEREGFVQSGAIPLAHIMPRKAFHADLKEATGDSIAPGISGVHAGEEDGTFLFTFTSSTAGSSPIVIQALVPGKMIMERFRCIRVSD